MSLTDRETITTEARPEYVQKIWDAITPEYFQISEKKGKDQPPAECISIADLSRLFDYLDVEHLIDKDILMRYLDDVQNYGLDYALTTVINPLLSRFIDFKNGVLSEEFIRKLGENYQKMIDVRKENSSMKDEAIKKDLAFQVLCAVKNIVNIAALKSYPSDPKVFFESILTGNYDTTLLLKHQVALFQEMKYIFTYENAIKIKEFFDENSEDLISLSVLSTDIIDRFNIDNFGSRLDVFFPLEKTDDLYAQFYFENLRLTQTKIMQALEAPTLSKKEKSELESIQQKINTIIQEMEGVQPDNIPKTLNFLSQTIESDSNIPTVDDEFANELRLAISMLKEPSPQRAKNYLNFLKAPDVFKTLENKTSSFKVTFKAFESLSMLISNEDPEFYKEADYLIRLTRNQALLFLFNKFSQKNTENTTLFRDFLGYQKTLTDQKITEPAKITAFYQEIIGKHLILENETFELFSKFYKYSENNHVGQLLILKNIYNALAQINALDTSSDTEEHKKNILEQLEKDLLKESLRLSLARGGDIKNLYDKFQTIIPNEKDLNNIFSEIKKELVETNKKDNQAETTNAYKKLLTMAVAADLARQKNMRYLGIATVILTAVVASIVSVFTFGAGIFLIPALYGAIALGVASLSGIGTGGFLFFKNKHLDQRIKNNQETLKNLESPARNEQTNISSKINIDGTLSSSRKSSTDSELSGRTTNSDISPPETRPPTPGVEEEHNSGASLTR